jgi:pimeloyl-ACP methyl ester carboxylesterase
MSILTTTTALAREVAVPINWEILEGSLSVPAAPRGLVLFAHGSGSSRLSPRNQHVAAVLQEHGLATLLFDLLTEREGQLDTFTAKFRFDIDLLARRLALATDWAREQETIASLPIGYFGASTGAAAALVAAAARPDRVGAVVSRGGRPDLAGEALRRIAAPTLLIVGGDDAPVIGLNERAMRQMNGCVELEIVPGATHLFEEPGTLDRAAELAAAWFAKYLPGHSG